MIINALRSMMRSVCGHVGANRSAGEERASAPVRALLAVFVAFACAISVSSYALAEESGGGGGGHAFEGPNVGIIFYGPTPALDSNANQVNEVGVTAYSDFDAAAYVLGYSYGEVRSWSSDIRAKLSNSETGGRFWQFAQTFTHTSNIDGVQWFVANILYGDDLCWRSLYSDELYRNALADCQTIINGGDVGGGGSGGEDQETGTFHLQFTDSGVTLKFNRYYMYQNVVYHPNEVNVGGTITPRSVPDVIYKLTNSNVLSLLQDTTLKVYIWGSDAFGGGGRGSTQLSVMITDDAPVVTTQESTYNSQTWTSQIYTWTYNASKRYYYVNSSSPSSGDGFIYTSGDIPAYTSFTTITAKIPPTGNGTNVPYYMGAAGGGGEPVVPPTNWPEEPSAPTPPELPEPGDPVVEPPEPYEPSTGPTFIWNITNTSEPTDTSSLLEWIKKIFYELKAIHSDLKTWFENLGDAITDGFEAMDNACGQIYGAITEQTDEMISQFSGLKDYLKQLFQWLKDQLNFQNDTFNDSNIVYWLKRIWSKLGSGDINLRPTDPTNDPDDWWDWLVKAIQNFLIGLAATSTELISEIADLASQVMHEFPFSIPWDIAAVLAALSTAPVTPVFTVTIPAISGWWNAFDIVIDMSPFNGAAETIRLMEKLLFTGLLIWKSKELLDFMDVTRWFD